VRHSFYYVVIPIMAGGVGEGAIPLSMGYAEIVHHDWGAIFAQVLPPVMFGSLTAILLAGVLNFVGRKRPELTGNGRLHPGENDELNPQQKEIDRSLDVPGIAAAGVTTLAIYLVGLVFFRLTVALGFPIPAPVGMLFMAVAIKLTHAVSPKLQQGAFFVYRFFAVAVTYPLLFAVGVAMTPWDKLVAALALPNLLAIVSTVVAMMATSFLTARWVNCYPIDVTIINACRCAQGGTGNVAILTASDRMQLMPFAQVATRIGGAVTVTLALVAYAKLH
jgi:Na+/citrate or Na+/malate symporter